MNCPDGGTAASTLRAVLAANQTRPATMTATIRRSVRIMLMSGAPYPFGNLPVRHRSKPLQRRDGFIRARGCGIAERAFRGGLVTVGEPDACSAGAHARHRRLPAVSPHAHQGVTRSRSDLSDDPGAGWPCSDEPERSGCHG